MLTASLAFAHPLDAAEWRQRHLAGEVPGGLPYGLDLMERYGVTPVITPPLNAIPRLLTAGLRKLGSSLDWGAVLNPMSGDVVVCWDERVGVPRALSPATRAPVVSGVIWADEQANSLTVAGLRRCAAVWGTSSAHLPVLRNLGVRRAEHLLFGVDADFWTPGTASERPTVVTVGNDRDRDYQTAIRAVAQLAGRVKLRLLTPHPVVIPPEIGEQAHLNHAMLREEIRSCAVAAVALKPNIHVSGVTSTLEAMACARPVVVTDNPGMRDYVTDGETGILVPPGDADAMAKAISSLLDDPARATAMGLAGRRAVESTFNTQARAGRLAAILKDVVG